MDPGLLRDRLANSSYKFALYIEKDVVIYRLMYALSIFYTLFQDTVSSLEQPIEINLKFSKFYKALDKIII